MFGRSPAKLRPRIRAISRPAMANPPPPTAPSKRPWYLAFALFAAMALGMIRGCSGLAVMAALHADGSDATAQCEAQIAQAGGTKNADGTTNADDHERVLALCQASLTSLSAARTRVFPIAIATLLFGFGVAFFAARARRGRPGARPLLIQLLVAQTVLGVVAYVLLPDTRRAEEDFAVAMMTAKQRVKNADAVETPEYRRAMQIAEQVQAPFALALGELANLLMILALTRPRARAFFDSTPDPASPQ
jgi:hypothetical protein